MANESWSSAHAALPRILTQGLGSVRCGVEVGVGFGGMAKALLDAIPGLRLSLVDPFVAYDPDDWTSDVMGICGDAVYAMVFEAVGGRAEIIRKPSVEAAAMFGDKSFDFVFIDGDHRYEAVAADIAAWRTKVRRGGMLCGHDYCERWPGVVRAVEESLGSVASDADSTIWSLVIS